MTHTVWLAAQRVEKGLKELTLHWAPARGSGTVSVTNAKSLWARVNGDASLHQWSERMLVRAGPMPSGSSAGEQYMLQKKMELTLQYELFPGHRG